jgi:hypothetical protein
MSIKHMTKVCSVAALVVLVFAALGPGKLVPRSGLGWEMDHFITVGWAYHLAGFDCPRLHSRFICLEEK